MTSEGDYYWRAVPVPGTSVRLGNLRQQPIIVEVRLSILLTAVGLLHQYAPGGHKVVR